MYLSGISFYTDLCGTQPFGGFLDGSRRAYVGKAQRLLMEVACAFCQYPAVHPASRSELVEELSDVIRAQVQKAPNLLRCQQQARQLLRFL